jgi:hypothetical protein
LKASSKRIPTKIVRKRTRLRLARGTHPGKMYYRRSLHHGQRRDAMQQEMATWMIARMSGSWQRCGS